MSRNVPNAALHRDYGATSSASNAISAIPDVNFSGFSPTEFVSLSENIAHNINSVKSNWMQLEKALKQIESNRSNSTTLEKANKIQTETNLNILATTKDLTRLTTVVRYGDKPSKLKLEKLTSDFQIIIEKYSASQLEIRKKINQINLKAALSQQDENSASGSTAIEKQQLVAAHKELQESLQFEQDMLVDRDESFRKVEAKVLDVNSIMRELSNLVTQQAENIDTIESSIDHSAAEVQDGAAELQKAAEYRTRYRKKILILLAIAVIIGLIVTGIIVSKLKS